MTPLLSIGHRGAKGHAPENTLLSFQKALDLGVDGIELDVHLSSDNYVMVIHDEMLNRTTSRDGYVNQLPLQELKSARIEKEHEIPTLDQVFELVDKKAFLNIELKGKATAKPVVSLLEKYVSKKNWRLDSILVSSFDWNQLQEVNTLNPKIPLGVLTETALDLAIAFAKFIKAATIIAHHHLLTAENTKQMQQDGFQVFAWTVNEPEDIQAVKSYLVNGIITDFPDRL